MIEKFRVRSVGMGNGEIGGAAREKAGISRQGTKNQERLEQKRAGFRGLEGSHLPLLEPLLAAVRRFRRSRLRRLQRQQAARSPQHP
jgi:hypothetical protein